MKRSIRQGIVVIVIQCILLAGGVLMYKTASLGRPTLRHDQRQLSSGQTRMSMAQYRQIVNEFTDIATRQDPSAALAQLREQIKTDDALARSCHDVAHEIGHAAYVKYRTFAEAAKYQDDACNSGYLHGVTEDLFENSKDPVALMKTLCTPYPSGKFASWQCYHGIGHGLMFATENDLPKSLSSCVSYQDAFARSTCVNGVFMENFNSDPDLHPSRFVKDDDSFYPCTEEAEEHKSDCYLYTPIHYLNRHQNDYAGALRWCAGAESAYRDICASGVGSQTIKENINNPKFAETICASGAVSQNTPCIAGMIGLYINHFGSLEPAQKLCEKLESMNKDICLQTIQKNSPLF